MIAIPNMDMPKSCKVCPFTCEKLAFFDGKNRPQGCPIIDIVTCGECVYYEESEYIEGDMVCKYHIGHTYYTEADRFCRYGERRSE